MENEFDNFVGFQWDQANIDKNLIKHNVENWESEQVFFNKPLLVLDDPKHSIPEKRWAAFGKTDAGRFLIVIFTKRGELIRVISARDMNKKERKFYDEKG
ncbi:MAG: BrnT family toxin [Deltaproteobacteria bacterium]|nr:BrnT family toxin [Deltaproteobacteria bacterium]MBW1795586.1 BrnT family toxin [Deltaproteobacteria bacterium]